MSLTDLHAGGGLMWVAGEITGLLGTLVAVRAVAARRRASRQAHTTGSAEAAAATQLAHWRATRDAAARALKELITLDGSAGRPRPGHAGHPAPPRSTGPTPCPAWPAGRSCSSRSTSSGPGRSRSGGRTTTWPSWRPGVAVVAASAGNHAQGVALAASLTGRAATIFMPRGAALPEGGGHPGLRRRGPPRRRGGRRLHRPGPRPSRPTPGAAYVPPFDDAAVIAGQGTIGLELAEEAPDAEVVVVPVGGGGLMSGVAAALTLSNGPVRVGPGGQLAGPRPHIRVVGVEAAGAPTLSRALAAGGPGDPRPGGHHGRRHRGGLPAAS